MIALREINIIKLFNRSINKKFSENYLSEDYHLKSVIPIWVLVLRTSGSYLFSKNPDDPKAQFGASAYKSSKEACFKSRRFPIEIVKSAFGKYKLEYGFFWVCDNGMLAYLKTLKSQMRWEVFGDVEMKWSLQKFTVPRRS